MINRASFLTAALLTSAGCDATTESAPSRAPTTVEPQVASDGGQRTSSWAGWAFVDGVGDFPFRLRVDAHGAAMDVVFADVMDMPLDDVSFDANELSFTWTSQSGDRREFHGERDGGVIDGRIDWAGAAGNFTLHRSAVPIAALDAESLGLGEGHYVFENTPGPADDDVWDVRRAGYGEVYVRSVRDGRQRVAWPSDDGALFLGSALYVPDVVSARIESRGAGVTVTHANGDIRNGDRITLDRRDEVIDTPEGPLRVVVTRRDYAPLGVGLVIVPGSSWEVAEDEAFRTDNLAALGLTVVTFDKRGHGQSPGSLVRPFADTAGDAGRVADWAAREFSTVSRWGVLGISRGGWIAPLIPQLNDRFDFAILSVSPAVSPYEQEFAARRAILRDQGAEDDLLDFADVYFDALVAFARSSATVDRDRYAHLHEEAQARLPEDLLGADPDADWRWWRTNGAYDPQAALGAINIPTLAIFGARDLNVPVEPNKALMASYDLASGGADITFIVMPDVGHDLALPFDEPIWALDTLGSEGIDEIWLWAVR